VRSEVRVVTGADSDLEEVRNEVRELQGIVQELERRREVYLEELREARRKRSEERSEKESEGQLALQDFTSSGDVDCGVISCGNSCSTHHHHGVSSCSSGAHTAPVATADERDDVLEMRQQKKESADDEMYCSCRMHLTTTRVKVIGR
jgi:DNA gyrase/topoisomerase IV subunit A